MPRQRILGRIAIVALPSSTRPSHGLLKTQACSRRRWRSSDIRYALRRIRLGSDGFTRKLASVRGLILEDVQISRRRMSSRRQDGEQAAELGAGFEAQLSLEQFPEPLVLAQRVADVALGEVHLDEPGMG